MFIGILGPILIAVGILRYFEDVGGIDYFTPFIGFILTMMYLSYLEGKAGISKRIIWIKSIISIATLFIIFYSN
jgi:hypothetical protein